MKFIIILSAFLINFSLTFSQTPGWFIQNSGTSNELRGVQFLNENTGWSAGFSYTIRKTTNGGLNWFTQNPGIPESFLAIRFVDENTGWAVGGNLNNVVTYVCKTTDSGQSWITQFVSYNTGCAFNLSFINAETGWIVCDKGNILKTTNGGLNWIILNIGSTTTICNCKFFNQNTGWIAGSNGMIMKTTNCGLNWQVQSSGITNNFSGMYFINMSTGFVSGVGGILLKTIDGGQNWIVKNSGTSDWLTSICFINSNTGYICGGTLSITNGFILKTTNSGENWTNQIIPVSSWLGSINFVNAEIGWTVGKNGTILKTTNGGIPFLSPPELISPPNNSYEISVTPALIWKKSGGANYYKIQISTVNNFSVITDSITVTDSIYNVPSGKLNGGLTYFWRVSAGNSSQLSDWSSVWNFATALLPSAPILISPPNGQIGTSTTPTLTWQALSNIINYTVQISTISNFQIITDSSTVTVNNYTVPFGKLSENITYFWRVKASNSYGSGPWSVVWNFVPRLTGFHSISSEIPDRTELHSNYPNPFNSVTNIRFDISTDNEIVKIRIFDIIGRELEVLVNEKLSAGRYEIKFDASNLSSGIYFYCLNAGQNIISKRMLITK